VYNPPQLLKMQSVQVGFVVGDLVGHCVGKAVGLTVVHVQPDAPPGRHHRWFLVARLRGLPPSVEQTALSSSQVHVPSRHVLFEYS